MHLHPSAPLLFVSVLRRTRATADLIPLLAEPLRSVLQGLGVRARAQHPRHAAAFLMALREVARAAEDEAREVLGEVSGVLGGEGSSGHLGAGGESADASGEGLAGVGPGEKASEVSPDLGAGEGSDDSQSGESADSLKGGKRKGEGSGVTSGSGQAQTPTKILESIDASTARDSDQEEDLGAGRVTRGVERGQPRGQHWEPEEWWEERKRRREAAAGVACSAVDACAPLMGAKSVQNRWAFWVDRGLRQTGVGLFLSGIHILTINTITTFVQCEHTEPIDPLFRPQRSAT